ncbi:MAG: hypothetical protein AB7H66_17100 [Hyphomonadaceae bacterium]
MNIDPVITLCLGLIAFGILNTWWVLRPFERARRERRQAERRAAE